MQKEFGEISDWATRKNSENEEFRQELIETAQVNAHWHTHFQGNLDLMIAHYNELLHEINHLKYQFEQFGGYNVHAYDGYSENAPEFLSSPFVVPPSEPQHSPKPVPSPKSEFGGRGGPQPLGPPPGPPCQVHLRGDGSIRLCLWILHPPSLSNVTPTPSNDFRARNSKN